MNRASAPSYDLFKLIVTIVLVLILILMLLRGCATLPAAPLSAASDSGSAPTQGSGPPVTTETIPPTDTSEVASPSAVPSATSTPLAATLTPTAEATTPTPVPVEVTPDSTATEPAATTETPATTTVDNTSCNTSRPSRLSVGQTARVLQRLNMRSAALITASILQTNPANAQVEIIGGPVCTPVDDSAYLWWQIRLANGAEGWSAETPLNDATYLLEPIP